MKSVYIVITLFFSLSLLLGSEPHWIFFKDKGPSPENIELSLKARERLARRGTPSTERDQVLYSPYLDSLRHLNVSIRHVSRWLNAVSIETEDNAVLEEITRLPFVASIKQVARSMRPKPLDAEPEYLARPGGFVYGPSFFQNSILDIPEIHARGYSGKGITIAVFDAGFRTDHSAFDNMDILATWDFISNEEDPDGSGDYHGINTLSLIGAFVPGELISPAYNATFILARTEDYDREIPAEEDHWVAAMEWADSLGADIISSSLAYLDFDGTDNDYDYSDLDGNTTTITKATNIAAERGILVVNAMGNEGPGDSSLWAPADGEHVLSVGAVTSQLILTSFSSRGPTADDRIKPDVIALGYNVHGAVPGDEYSSYLSGTSYSTPQIAGAAALVMQWDPALTPDSIITLFRKSGDNSDSPNNDYGWGLPSLLKIFGSDYVAATELCQVWPNPSHGGELNISIPGYQAALVNRVDVYDLLGRKIGSYQPEYSDKYAISIQFKLKQGLADQLLFIVAHTPQHMYSGKFLFLN